MGKGFFFLQYQLFLQCKKNPTNQDCKPQRNPSSRPVTIGAGLAFVTVGVVFLGISLRAEYAVPKEDPAIIRGEALVAKFGCKTCHRIHGDGANVAPDLSFVADRRPKPQQQIQHFKDPQSVSPNSFMPKFPLTNQQVGDLTSYILTRKSRLVNYSIFNIALGIIGRYPDEDLC